MTDEELTELIASVTGKRPRAVLDHILKHGQITTEELKEQYGYAHAPRAARDVREHGIPLVTFTVTAKDGRSIAAYKLGDPAEATASKAGGRQAISKAFKAALVAEYGEMCCLCGVALPARGLQVDHRVPFEVAGEGSSTREVADYMLLCNSCNRAKSWSCEACENWLRTKEPDTCMDCYWGSPEDYSHIAGVDVRRLDIVWQEGEIKAYERLREKAAKAGMTLADYLKAITGGGV